MPHDLERGKLYLKQCVVEQEWLDSVARTVLENLQNAAELSG